MPVKFGRLISAEMAAAGAELRPEAVFTAADFAGQAPIIAAVSGGGDSLALLLLLHDFLRRRGAAGRLRAVTIDHQLRPEAAAEAVYVAGLCAQAGIAHKTLIWPGPKPAAGVEAAARAARYALLRREAARQGAAFICAGHNLEDQAETYFMRLARLGGRTAAMGAAAADGEAAREADNAAAAKGASDEADSFSAARAALRRRGLAGMARQSLLGGSEIQLLRPLLAIHRAALRRFLAARGVQWVEDASNYDCHYERVRLRQSMTAEQAEQAAGKAALAGQQRQALSEAAAALGRALHLRAEGGGGSGAARQFRFDLAPLQQRQISLAQQAAPLYLLLAAAAALGGGRAYLSPDNAGLWQFLPCLAREGKGEKPQCASAMSAVLEKRRAELSIRPERRRAGELRQNGGAAAAEFGGGLFAGIIPFWDAPLYALFAPYLAGAGGR